MNTLNLFNDSSASRWLRHVALFLATVMCAMLLMLMSHAAHAAPPAVGTKIGNQASASYTDGSGISRTVTSNLVQTVVQQVGGLTLTANGAQTATPGTTVYYPHTLTNTGNGPDTFSLTAVNVASLIWSLGDIQIYADDGTGRPTGSPITDSPQLAMNGLFKFVVVATVPTAATAGQTKQLTVTATSKFDTKTASNTDTTTVTTNAVITLNKSVTPGSGAPGSTVTYTITYTNNGNTTATNVNITDSVPAGMAYVANSSVWSVNGLAAMTDDSSYGTPPNTLTPTITSGTLKYAISQVAPGQSGTITFKVTVGTTTAPGTISNTASVSYNDGSGATLTTNSNAVPFTVTHTAGVTLTGPSPVPSASPGASVSFSNLVKNTGNGTDTFNITFGTNTFPAGTTFKLYKSDGVTPLLDTGTDGIPDTGPLAAGATYNVIVVAQLPANAASTTTAMGVSKTATSVQDSTKTATATDTLSAIVGSSVDLTNDQSLAANPSALGKDPGPEATAMVTNTTNPATTTTFQLWVNNTGPVADTYTLAASTASNFSTITLPTGWTVTFKADGGAGNCSTTSGTLTSTSNVPAGGNQLVCAVVNVPAGAAAATTDIFFRAASSATAAKDVIHDAVTVNPIRSIALTTTGSGQTYPNGTVIYTHTLTNTGNVVEGNGTVSSIALGVANSNTMVGWSSVLYYDANGNSAIDNSDPVISGNLNAVGGLEAGLAPGQSILIFNKVTASSNANAGDSNTTTITATTTKGTHLSAAPAVASTTDLTTVIAGNLQLLKEQALDANCACATALSITYSYTSSNISAKPGECVVYRITATNAGTADATNVVISDSTPSYTTTAGSAAVTPGTATVTGPASGSTGTYTATVGTLAPAATATLTFGVKINQ